VGNNLYTDRKLPRPILGQFQALDATYVELEVIKE
jgi:hypothetical protein